MKVAVLNNVTKKQNLTAGAAGIAGFTAGQFALSKVNKFWADGAGVAIGVSMAGHSNPAYRAAAIGLATVSGIRLINRMMKPTGGKASSAQSLLGAYVPDLQGLGELGELGYNLGNVSDAPLAVYSDTGALLDMAGMDGDEDYLSGDEDYLNGDEEDLSGDEDFGFDGIDGDDLF